MNVRHIERLWHGPASPRVRAARWALAPAETLYRATIALRNAAYNKRARVQHADVPVVSVGSLLVGGAGKTPFTRWIIEHYLVRNIKPALLHGGYADDEPQLHRLWHPGLPVIAARDLVRAARAAVAAGAQVLVLDDAFQHRRLARELDIVLVPS